MPGTFRRTAESNVVMGPQPKPQPPPVAARSSRVTVQSWQTTSTMAEKADCDGADFSHVRCGSMDSVDSNSGSSGSSVCSSSGVGNSHSRQLSSDSSGDFLPTRTVGKTPALPSHNPLQFVKVQSPLYKKAELQVKISKEVKISRATLKEGEEEWQSNLDNWKSRRRKVSEKVIQRAEEMRQVEAEEQHRQHQLQQQQRKVRTFSEIIEKRSVKKRSYNLELYMGQGDDSGVGDTPEPDDQEGALDSQNSILRSDTSEGMTSETESVDSDVRSSDKIITKEPPKVPKKPYSWLSRKESCMEDSSINRTSSPNDLLHHCLANKDLPNSENISSAEPSDIEGHAADTETVSSEDDAGYCGRVGNTDSGLDSLCDRPDVADNASDFSQDSCGGLDKINHETDLELASSDELDDCQFKKENSVKIETLKNSEIQNDCGDTLNFRIFLKQGLDTKGFGFNLKGGKDQGSAAIVDSVVSAGPADIAGLKSGDHILSINGESTSGCSHSSLIFSVKQAVYTEQLDLVVQRSSKQVNAKEEKQKQSKRGASFAEKLALFSSGTTSTGVLSSSSKSSISTGAPKPVKVEELKTESLVLRRRSTFENSSAKKDENQSRWSSCVSQETSCISKALGDERRHSVDFTKCSENFLETSGAKKTRPPPVPAKPKLKPKPLLQANVQDGDFSSHEATTPNFIKNNLQPMMISCSFPEEQEPIIQNSVHNVHSGNMEDSTDETKFSSISSEELPLTPPELEHPEHQTSTVAVPFDIFENIDKQADDLSVDAVVLNGNSCVDEPFVVKSEQSVDNTIFSGLNLNDPELNECIGNGDKNFSHQNVQIGLDAVDNDVNYLGNNTSNLTMTDMHEETQCNDTYETSQISSVETSCINMLLAPMEAESNSVNFQSATSLENEQSALISSIQIVNPNTFLEPEQIAFPDAAEDNAILMPVESDLLNSYSNSLQTEFLSESLDIIESEVSTEDRENFLQINVHPLGLLLEKIDEDDVFSASTTTSSETPDTETVIDNFPANISPLPNDDVIGETSGITALHPSLDRDISESIETSLVEKPNFISTENVMLQVQMSSTPSGNEESAHNCEQDFNEDELDNCDQYELEESTDQLSPLDVIDQIELKLMQQLELQGNMMFEDINDIGGQLEDEVTRQLLYLSEDSDFLDDLDAPRRNMKPPSEPPPPPPPPEPENIENTTSPFQRANSTKRIKKELWRRRSDFLGLDSPEGIDVDNIPPPPPGLEELLKSEMEKKKEQRLWLEKRLSLVETKYTSDVISPNIHQSSDAYSPSDEYSSDYMLEVYDAEVYDAVNTNEPQTEDWKTKVECQIPVSDTVDHEIQQEDLETDIPSDTFETKPAMESPEHKAKNHIQSLGAAPRAKIMDSNKWITQAEKHAPFVKQKSVDPLFREGSYNQNYWLAQEVEKRSSVDRVHVAVDRRYSMPPTYGSRQPDVTVRTWDDREFEFQQQQRPKSGPWQGLPSSVAQPYGSYAHPNYISGSRTQMMSSHYEQDADPQRPANLSHKCSSCGDDLSEGSAMGIDTLQLYFHIECFRCCVCQVQLGNGSCGTDVQVKDSQLYCPNCFTVD